LIGVKKIQAGCARPTIIAPLAKDVSHNICQGRQYALLEGGHNQQALCSQ